MILWGLPVFAWLVPGLFAVLIVWKIARELGYTVNRGRFSRRHHVARGETAERAIKIAHPDEIPPLVTGTTCVCGQRFHMLSTQSRSTARMGDQELEIVRVACNGCARSRPFYFARG